ncbi:MAG: hypothetical protein ACE363_08925 [Alphaproteobacteria bacterium]
MGRALFSGDGSDLEATALTIDVVTPDDIDALLDGTLPREQAEFVWTSIIEDPRARDYAASIAHIA